MAKEYTVISHHHGRETEFSGTIEHLINDVFSYTLECRRYSDWYELKAA